MFILVNFGVDSRYNFKIYLRKLKESSCIVYLKACKLISLTLNKKGETMINYSGRTGMCRWLYKNEDWWIPLFLIALTFFTPVIIMYLTYLFLN